MRYAGSQQGRIRHCGRVTGGGGWSREQRRAVPRDGEVTWPWAAAVGLRAIWQVGCLRRDDRLDAGRPGRGGSRPTPDWGNCRAGLLATMWGRGPREDSIPPLSCPSVSGRSGQSTLDQKRVWPMGHGGGGPRLPHVQVGPASEDGTSGQRQSCPEPVASQACWAGGALPASQWSKGLPALGEHQKGGEGHDTNLTQGYPQMEDAAAT